MKILKMERQEIIKFLKNPKSYPYPVKKVKHLETYISDIFLTGKYAYKIKKPVNYGYLDFTTLAKRKFFSFQELKLNRRLSPKMYLDVLPLREKNGKLKLGNHGKIIEYVLKMKEIPQKYLMNQLLKRGKINQKIIDQLAKIIAKFHRQTITSKKISSFGSLKVIKKNWQENFLQTRQFIGKTISKDDFDFIKKSIEKFIVKNKKLFQQRVKDKKIRDCHGDLHTGNIFIMPKKIFIFDCIEFNDRFRYQDVANEIAFLTMDLDFLGRNDLGEFFLKRYLYYSADKINKKLLLFYKCYRAYIKGKVMSFSLNQFSKRKYLSKIKKYFQLAKKYVEHLRKPALILGAGLPGIGRSTRLRILAKEIGAKILDSDVLRQKFLKSISYDKKSKLLVYKKMMKIAEKFLKNGYDVILDATFSKEKYRKLARNLAKKLEIPYFLIQFYCSEKIAKERLTKRAKEKSVSQANWQVYQKIKKEFEPIKEKLNFFKINTALTPKQSVREIVEKIFL